MGIFNVITLFIITVFPVVIASYLIVYFNNKLKNKSIKRHFILTLKNNPLIIVVFFAGIAIFTVNILFTEPQISDPFQMIKYGKKRNIPEMVEKGYENLILKDFKNPELHYNYIKYHFERKSSKRIGKNIIMRNDNDIVSFYNYLKYRDDDTLVYIGHLGHACCLFFQKKYYSTIVYIKNHSELDKPFENYLVGSSFYKLGQISIAERYLLRELKIKNGYYKGSIETLGNLYVKSKWKNSTVKTIYQPQYRKYINYNDLKNLAFLNQDYKGFFKYFFLNLFNRSDILGWIAALLICFAWVYYLWYLDIFNREKWTTTIIVLVAGALLSTLVSFISLYLKYEFNFPVNDNNLHDLLYLIGFIALPEEIIKILPLIFLLIFTKYLKEPYDYIYYASISALGFSFIENILYFDSSSLHIIHGRALISVVGHMFYSSLIAYGIILSKYRKKIKTIYAVFIYLILASILHGLYNYLLIRNYQFVFILFYLIIIRIWSIMINNALNNSEFFDYNIRLNTKRLRFYIVTILSSILIFEYVSISWIYGPKAANATILNSSIFGSIIIFFLASRLSLFDLVKKQWRIINWKINPFIIKHYPLNFVGYKIQIRSYYLSNKTADILSNNVTAKIINRITVTVKFHKVVYENLNYC
ncbi:MAG: hypothetical protein Kow0068_23140 [Marinilabiliales bacterium]